MSNSMILHTPRKWVVSRNQLITILLFIIYPLGALPLILIEIYHQKAYAFTLFALWLGLFAVLYAPVTDYYRHIQIYYSYKTISWHEFIQIPKMDIVLPYLSFVAAKLHIHFEYIRFLFTYTAIQICFWIFNDIAKTNSSLRNNKLYYFLSFITLCFCCNYFTLIIGLRSVMANALILLSAYLLFMKSDGQKSKKGYLFGILGAIVHFGLTPYVIGLFLLRLFPIHFSKTKTFLLFIAGCILSSWALNYFLSLLGNDFLVTRLDAYVNGAWGTDVRSRQNLNGIIFSYLSRLMLFPLLIYVIGEHWRGQYVNTIALGIIILGLVMNFPTIQGRYVNLMILIIYIFLLYSYRPTRLIRFSLKLTFLCGLLFFTATIYSQRKSFPVSREYMWLYAPSFVIINNTFDQNWINQHIDHEGMPKENI